LKKPRYKILPELNTPIVYDTFF